MSAEETLSPFRRALRPILRDPLSCACLTALGLFVLLAVGCELYAAFAENPLYRVENLQQCYAPPDGIHWFGTDYLGRDVFLRTLQGSATALKVGVIATFISMVIGTMLGILSGYFGGVLDDFIHWIYATFAAMPTMLFILAFAMLVNKGFLFPGADKALHYMARNWGLDIGMLAVYLGIGLTGWVSLYKVTRSETLKLRERPFVLAAGMTGISTPRILLRHILPNLAHLVIIYAAMRFGMAIMTEVIVSYLGLGISLEPSWGTLIAEGQQRLWEGVWWEAAAATAAIFAVVLPLNILGDRLRDALDPTLQS